MTDRNLGYSPRLDGLRGIAMLVVVWAHTYPGPFRRIGGVGVEVFFVMSGFLITALLIEEHRRSGSIDLRAFYRRRAARLLPAMAVTLWFCLVLAMVLQSRSALVGVIANLGYVANIAAMNVDIAPLDHTWSLSVEEHFYLLWPVLFVVASRWRRGVLGAALLLVIFSTTWRMWLQADGASWYRLAAGTDTRAAGLALGCLGASLWYSLPLRIPKVLVPASFAVLLYAGTIGGLGWISALPAMQLSALILVIHCASATTPGILGSRPLVRAGQLSYAVYLFHLPLLWMAGDGAGLAPTRAVLALGMTWIAAEASMRYVEAPARRRWGHRSAPRVDGARNSATDLSGHA